MGLREAECDNDNETPREWDYGAASASSTTGRHSWAGLKTGDDGLIQAAAGGRFAVGLRVKRSG
jgi:hypothetical protein